MLDTLSLNLPAGARGAIRRLYPPPAVHFLALVPLHPMQMHDDVCLACRILTQASVCTVVLDSDLACYILRSRP